MPVLIDTTVWSLALRRRAGDLSDPQRTTVDAWADLVRRRQVVLLGLVRQELLSGVRDSRQFERLRAHLRSWQDEALGPEDHEEAARFSNLCRAAGVAGSPVDFLICAVARRRRIPIFTTDGDFTHYAKVLPIRLYHPARPSS